MTYSAVAKILLASIHRLETQICEAAAKLPPSPPDVLEQIAARVDMRL